MKCVYCGETFQPFAPQQKFCCYAHKHRYELYGKGKVKVATIEEAPKPPRKSLEAWAAEALECNLDYGTYRALIASGKTFEELKTSAGNRRAPIHSHVHTKTR